MAEERNHFGWTFEPWEPPDPMPPEGEPWVVQHGIDYVIAEVRSSYWYGWKSDRKLIGEVLPTRAYIDPNDPPTLDSVPAGEVCATNEGMVYRIGNVAYESLTKQRLGNSADFRYIRVFARPNALAGMDRGWPKTLRDLPRGVYAEVEGVPCNRCGMLPGSIIRAQPESSTIDTDSDGRPKILGSLVEGGDG